ncbi:ATP-NAD kinase-like domain-containing protein [Pelagophyceae sp. CCMP2097]|nr:ATP-NAD kinase-like domain-containing protein [Pelagophyceae sp. CCMP2097]|mmetsp:Transcript_21240/g.73293  ORF Transcript_21240/g.73293 Transcript_21240/m.73293 type:complete len:419 (-) Transcript_21240:12-1268(-)
MAQWSISRLRLFVLHWCLSLRCRGVAGWAPARYSARSRLRSTQVTSEVDDDLAWVFSRSHEETAEDECEVPGDSSTRCVATSQHRVVWRRRPRSVLVLAKRHADSAEIDAACELCAKLAAEKCDVLLAQPLFDRLVDRLKARQINATEWHQDTAQGDPDFVSTLGGDGLLLYANTLFQRGRPPPVMAFSSGSLGFLAPFDSDATTVGETVRSLMSRSRWPVSLRLRLRCRIVSADGVEIARHEALNEAVVDRGSSPFLSAVACFCNNEHLTTVQADGLIVATPTGSTAYSLAAGGPMLHPSAPAIVFTPICPHSLAFRPIVFADSAKLRLDVDPHARADAWVTFDGRRRVRLRRGAKLYVEASPFPLPTVLRRGNTADWFEGLHSSFNFNTRARQKPFPPDTATDFPPNTTAEGPAFL